MALHVCMAMAALVLCSVRGAVAQDQCNSTLTGNGHCDDGNNNSDCGYDGGDCCPCTCIDGDNHDCGSDGFNYCLDPNAGDVLYNCKDALTAASPCSETRQPWVVESTLDALALASAVNCSGGFFDVEWRGSVVVEKPIFVIVGTVLNVTGVGDAVVDGGNRTRPFTVIDASLHLSRINVSHGAAIAGGALAAAGSTLTFDNTAFNGNTALIDSGGALLVSDSSHLSFHGGGVFLDNVARVGGGAASVSGSSVVHFDGEAFFLANTAEYGSGGALFVDGNSSLSWNWTATFAGNYAHNSGGGMRLTEQSTTSFYKNVHFANNRIQTDADTSFGGAIFVNGYSSVSWSGEAEFVGNRGSRGGAMCIADANVSWSGATTFADNFAGRDGGAMTVWDESTVTWTGETAFVGNEAREGGALYTWDSIDNFTVSWSGETRFISNKANLSGGAMVLGGSVSWSGDTWFVDNEAPNGGAVRAWETNEGTMSASWSGQTLFLNNKANVTGGAIIVSGKISWSGDTSFVGNEAVQGGAIGVEDGAIVTYDGRTTFTSNHATAIGGAVGPNPFAFGAQDSYFIINGTTIFENNTSGANGGGIGTLGALNFELETEDIIFSGNVAEVAGGAVFLSGIGVGPSFVGATFSANSANVGGGVYAVGSGTTVTEDVAPNPTRFTRCRFIGNAASTTGGAIESAAGQDVLDGNWFEGNSAGIGGALRLAGTVSVMNSSFVDNVSSEGGGAAVSNIGNLWEVSTSSFIGNTISCPSGKYLDTNESESLFDTVCDGCPMCGDCYLENPTTSPVCETELPLSSSSGGDRTIADLTITPGYWRATNESHAILACYNADACLGGVTGSSDYCQTGFEGPYCSVCSTGCTAGLGYFCEKCSHPTEIKVVMGLVGLLALISAGVLVQFLVSGKKGMASHGIARGITRYIPLQSVKIVLVVWQILTQFATVANVTYPGLYDHFLSVIDIVNFDLTWVVSAGCIYEADFHDRLLISTIGPIGTVCLLGGIYAIAVHRNRGSEEGLRNVRHKHVSAFMLLTFVVYSSVSSMVFQMFACDPLDDNTSYLRADYRIDCDSSKHRALQAYSRVMIVVYPFGIPALYAIVLFSNRNVLTNDVEDREECSSAHQITHLWKPFKPERYYYEVIECGRRIMLTGLIVFVFPNTAAQISIALVIAFVFFGIAEGLSPYVSGWDRWISRAGHVIVFMSMYIALLLKVDVSEEQDTSQKTFEAILVVSHIFLIVAVVAEALVVACSMTKVDRTAGLGQNGQNESNTPQRTQGDSHLVEVNPYINEATAEALSHETRHASEAGEAAIQV